MGAYRLVAGLLIQPTHGISVDLHQASRWPHATAVGEMFQHGHGLIGGQAGWPQHRTLAL